MPTLAGKVDLSAPVFGSHVGYNYQSGNVLAGIELDFENALKSGSTGDGVVDGVPGAYVTGGAELKWQASVRGRLGLVRDNTLYYATAGVVWGRFDFSYSFPAVGGVTDSFSETLTGWTAGAGIETVLAGNWTARIEYRYTDFGSASGSIANCCATAPNAQDHDVESHTVRIGLSRKL